MESWSPLPLLRGVSSLPGRHPCIGTPEDLITSTAPVLQNGRAPSPLSDCVLPRSASLRTFNSSSVDTNVAEKPLCFQRHQNCSLGESGHGETCCRLLSCEASSIRLMPPKAKVKPISKKSTECPQEREVPVKGTPVVPSNAQFFPAKRTSVRKVTGDDNNRHSLNSTATTAVEAEAESILGNSRALRKSWEGATELKEAKLSRRTNDNVPTKFQKSLPASAKTVAIKSQKDGANSEVKEKKTATSTVSGSSASLANANNYLRKWTDDSVPWDSLPPHLIMPGKEVMKQRDSASLAAVQALKEASVAESVIRSLSMFAELCSSATSDNPQTSIEKFLEIHVAVTEATSVADAMACMERCNRESASTGTSVIVCDDTLRISSEKLNKAMSWVGAALSTDLAPFSISSKQTGVHISKNSAKKEMTNSSISQLTITPEKSSSSQTRTLSKLSVKQGASTASSPQPLNNQTVAEKRRAAGQDTEPLSFLKGTRSRIQNTINEISVNPTKLTNKVRIDASAHDLPVVIDWVEAAGLQETAELTKCLHQESQNWFLKYMESVLDSRLHAAGAGEGIVNDSASKVHNEHENTQVAAVLSQLKRVNDWLDQVDDGKEMLDAELTDTLFRIKRKIYDFLLHHVESAAVALGNLEAPSKTT